MEDALTIRDIESLIFEYLKQLETVKRQGLNQKNRKHIGFMTKESQED